MIKKSKKLPTSFMRRQVYAESLEDRVFALQLYTVNEIPCIHVYAYHYSYERKSNGLHCSSISTTSSGVLPYLSSWLP